MKTLTRWILLLGVWSFLCGCATFATFKDHAYSAVGAMDVAVNLAMGAFYAYEGERGDAATVKKVEHVHDIYKKARKVFDDVMVGYTEHPDESAVLRAIDSLNYAAISIVQLVLAIIPEDQLEHAKAEAAQVRLASINTRTIR